MNYNELAKKIIELENKIQNNDLTEKEKEIYGNEMFCLIIENVKTLNDLDYLDDLIQEKIKK